MKTSLEILQEKYNELQALNNYRQYQIAEMIGRDPGQLSRVLKGEGNEEVRRRFTTVLEMAIEGHRLREQVADFEEQAEQTKKRLEDKKIPKNPEADDNGGSFKPTRRDVIVGGGMAVATMLLPMLCTGFRKEHLTIRCNYHPDDPVLGNNEFINKWIKEIEELAPGKIEIKNPEKKTPDDVYDRFKRADDGYDMLHTVTYYQDADKYLTIFASIPFGMDSTCFDAWFYSEGQQILRDIQSKTDKFELLPLGNTGPQAGGWFFPEIPNNKKSFKDFEMRIYGLGKEVVEMLGADTIDGFLSAEEVKKRIIKNIGLNKKFGIEYINGHVDSAIGYDRIAKQHNGIFVKEGWQEPGTVWSLLVNKEALAKFEKVGIKMEHLEAITMKYHRLITDAYITAGKKKLREWEGQEQRGTLGFIMKEKFPDELLNELKEKTRKIVQNDIDRGDGRPTPFGRLFTSYADFYEIWTGRSFWKL